MTYLFPFLLGSPTQLNQVCILISRSLANTTVLEIVRLHIFSCNSSNTMWFIQSYESVLIAGYILRLWVESIRHVLRTQWSLGFLEFTSSARHVKKCYLSYTSRLKSLLGKLWHLIQKDSASVDEKPFRVQSDVHKQSSHNSFWVKS